MARLAKLVCTIPAAFFPSIGNFRLIFERYVTDEVIDQAMLLPM